MMEKTRATSSSGSKEVVVFGGDHSPWTQAVLFKLAEQGYSVTVRPFPQSFWAYIRHGLVVPLVQWPDGSLTSDSFDILARLFGEDPDDYRRDQVELEKLFVSYVSTRMGGGLPTFLHGFAKIRNVQQAWTTIAVRALITWYFAFLVSMAHLRARGNENIGDGEWIRKLLKGWDDRLESGPFLGGRQQPGLLDFELIGQMECMSCGLTDWTMPVLRLYPNLMRWLKQMHMRLEEYPHLVVYSRRVFSPSTGPEGVSCAKMAWFYLCLAGWLLLLPVTLPFLGFPLVRRNWNQNRVGAR